MIELYAVVDHPGPRLPTLARLRTAATTRLAAIYAPADDGEISPERLWRHEEIVEALMQDRDLLPVRYGTRLDDERAATRFLTDREEPLVSALDEVRGAVELAVRVLRTGERPDARSRPDPVTSGAEYLRRKAGSAAAERSATLAVHEPLSAAARRDVRRPSSVTGELLRAAYLVDRNRVDEFVSLVARLQDANPALRLLCTGPWPPYSFAER
jgi:hypothetical protein